MGTFAPPLTTAERARLVAILGMLGSSFEGEQKAAALAATRFLKERSLTWNDVIAPCHAWSTHHAYRPGPPPSESSTGWRGDLALCKRHLAELDGWPAGFVISMSGWRKTLSPEQVAKLAQIACKLRSQGFE